MIQPYILGIFLPIFGVSLLIILLNVKRSVFTIEKTTKLIIFTVLVLIINILVFIYFGRVTYSRFYIILIQLPLYIAFHKISQYSDIKLLFTLLTAITFASIPVFVVTTLKILTDSNIFFMIFSCLFSYWLVLVLVIKFMSTNFIYALEYGDYKLFWKLSIIPILYYVYGFLSSQYNFIQYTQLDNIFINHIPNMIVLISYVLLIDIFKGSHEKQQLVNEYNFLSLQINASTKQIDVLRTAQNQTAIYRHDMRHHFSLIYSYLLNNEKQKALAYIEDIESSIMAFTPIHYCENKTANPILSTFVDKPHKLNITLELYVVLFETIFIPETDL